MREFWYISKKGRPLHKPFFYTLKKKKKGKSLCTMQYMQKCFRRGWFEEKSNYYRKWKTVPLLRKIFKKWLLILPLLRQTCIKTVNIKTSIIVIKGKNISNKTVGRIKTSVVMFFSMVYKRRSAKLPRSIKLSDSGKIKVSINSA